MLLYDCPIQGTSPTLQLLLIQLLQRLSLSSPSACRACCSCHVIREYLTEFTLCQYGLIRILFPTSVVECHASCWHQCSTKVLVLIEHRLIGCLDEIIEILRLTVYWVSLPPYYLVCLPTCGGHLLGILACVFRRQPFTYSSNVRSPGLCLADVTTSLGNTARPVVTKVITAS